MAVASNPELHPNREAVLVVILAFSFGECGLLDRRPHDRFGALVECAVHDEFHKLVGDHRFGVVIHRQIGIGPVAGHTQTLEFLALDVDPAFSEFATFLAQLDHGHIVFVFALLAVLLFDFPFDGQAVAVPAGNIAAVMAHHLLRAHDHVLKDFVQPMADVQMAVGVWRAVVKDEGRALARGFAQAVVDADPLPAREPVRFTVWQSSAHGKISFG